MSRSDTVKLNAPNSPPTFTDMLQTIFVVVERVPDARSKVIISFVELNHGILLVVSVQTVPLPEPPVNAQNRVKS